MLFLMQEVTQESGKCFWSCGQINWAALAVLLQVLTLAYLAYAFQRTTRNQTRLEEYLKGMLGKDE